EATTIRKGLRGAINPIVDRLWHEKITTEPFTASSEGEKLYLAILSLSTQNETQRSLQARAVQVANDLVQVRLLLSRACRVHDACVTRALIHQTCVYRKPNPRCLAERIA